MRLGRLGRLGGAGKFAAGGPIGVAAEEVAGFKAGSDARFGGRSLTRSAPRPGGSAAGLPGAEWPDEGSAGGGGGAYGVAGLGATLSFVNDGGGGGATCVMN